MQTLHIIAGFSDIKSELRTKANITKPLQELELWFTYEDEVLYAHDYADHQKCIALALYKPTNKSWHCYLRKGSYGEKLVIQACENIPINLLVKVFYKFYRLYGFIAFSGG